MWFNKFEFICFLCMNDQTTHTASLLKWMLGNACAWLTCLVSAALSAVYCCVRTQICAGRLWDRSEMSSRWRRARADVFSSVTAKAAVCTTVTVLSAGRLGFGLHHAVVCPESLLWKKNISNYQLNHKSASYVLIFFQKTFLSILISIILKKSVWSELMHEHSTYIYYLRITSEAHSDFSHVTWCHH